MTAEEYKQFMADVSEVEKDFTFNIGARVMTGVDLLRFEAVNGARGTDKDAGAQKDELRAVTYGNTVDKNSTDTSARGYYDAFGNTVAKQMRMEGLKIVVHYDAGADDEYVVGTDTLPSTFHWQSGNGSVTAPTDNSQFNLNFAGADITTNLSVRVDGLADASNTVTKTMANRPI